MGRLKKLLSVFLAMVMMMSCLLVIPANVEAATSDPTNELALRELVGVWRGDFVNSSGPGGVTLDVFEENGNFYAIRTNFNLPGRTNQRPFSVRKRVTFDPTTERYLLVFQEWIVRPRNTAALNFTGEIEGDTFSGDTLHSSTTRRTGNTFHTVRVEEGRVLSRTIETVASPRNGGTVLGGGEVPLGYDITLQAIPNDGWVFEGWYESGIEADVLMHTDERWEFTVDSNRTLEARFTRLVEQDLPPTRIITYDRDIYNLLNNSDFYNLFPDYTRFTSVFINDVDMRYVLALGLTSDIRRQLVVGMITGGIDGAVDAIMNDHSRVNNVLYKLINQVTGTYVYSADKEMGRMLDFFANSLGAFNNDAGYAFKLLKEFDQILEIAKIDLENYYQNIRMLQSIERISNSPQFNQTINSLLARYQRDLAQKFGELREYFLEKSINQAVVLAFGKPTVAITSGLDFGIGLIDAVGGLETIIITDNLNVEATIAFRNAANKIVQGDLSYEALESYRNTFYLARGLQIIRYEAMGTHFDRGTAERDYIDTHLEKLRSMTHYNFIFAERFRPAIEVPSGWAAEQIDAAIAAGLVPQNLQSNYTRAITHAEFADLAVALYESQGRWVDMRLFGRLGFIDTIGLEGGLMAQHSTLTREEAAVALSLLADAIGHPLPRHAPTFYDSAQISREARDAVGSVQAARIMGGVGNNRFAPRELFTREQGIVTIMRLFEFIN